MAKRNTGAGALIERTKAAAHAHNQKLLADLLATIRRRMTSVAEGFYDIGEALREVLDKKLYGVAGHDSLKALLEAEGLMSVRQATKLIALVRKVPREEALALGQERAAALVAYVDATPEDDTVAGVLRAGGEIGGAPVATASVRQIEAATREVRSKGPVGPRSAAQRAKAKTDAALAKGLRAALRTAGIGGAEVTVGRNKVRVVLTRASVERLTREG